MKKSAVLLTVVIMLINSTVYAEMRKEYYESGQLKTDANFKDGKQEGITRTYYESRKVETERNFKDGKPEGISKGYYKDGNVRYISTYKNGKIEGVSKSYYESGRLMGELNFKDDKPVPFNRNLWYTFAQRLEQLTYLMMSLA